MIIDSHQHVFWHGRDDAGLIADMDESGIDQAWLLTWEIPQHPIYADNFDYHALLNPARLRADGTHPGVPLEDLLIAHRRFPNRFILGYCPDPSMENACKLFEAAVKMHGVRVCGEWKFRMPFDDPRCLELFRVAGQYRAPVVLHLDVPYLNGVYQPKWYGGTIDNLERALRVCPDTIFIGHAPGFWREISGDAANDAAIYPSGPITPGGRLIELLERYPNLYADLSAGSALTALRRDLSFSANLLTRFSDRFLFGRDYYGNALHILLQELKLLKDIQDRIYRQNAEQMLSC